MYLNYNFSRLTLNSTALRTYHCATSFRPLSAARKRHAEVAIDSAIATLVNVLDVPAIQDSLVGTQLFLHSMITFSAVFLLKILVKVHPNCVLGPNSQHNSLAAAGLKIDIPYVLDVIEKIVNIMISASEKASERHVSHHIARGLSKMLEGYREWEQRNHHPSNSNFNQDKNNAHASNHLNNNNNNSSSNDIVRSRQPSWLHDTPSLFNTVSLANAQSFGGHSTILNRPPPAMLGIAPLSSERSNNHTHDTTNSNITTQHHPTANNINQRGISTGTNMSHTNRSFASNPAVAATDLSAKSSQAGLSEGSLDPMMTDMWGFEEEYFPMGVFDFLQSQMPA